MCTNMYTQTQIDTDVQYANCTNVHTDKAIASEKGVYMNVPISSVIAVRRVDRVFATPFGSRHLMLKRESQQCSPDYYLYLLSPR